MQSLPDDLLVNDLKSGSEWAFTQIYNRYYARLHMEANYVLKDKDEAADVIHDVLVTIWKKRDSLPENMFLKSYLSACVKNKCMDKIRKKMIKEKNEKRYAELKELSIQFNPLENKELSLQIANVINALPLAQRNVFELSYLQDKSQREIMDEKGISLQTVKNQISTTLKILRKKLKSAYEQ
ncbi:RNA polymerase sigma-70 factor [Chitinophaga solisilvae]|uniref:RNA polymerase sigma-70 factor n=1 Tax=Chitinophaga solisilvae TaxID=1233460 RepID=A0A433WCI6_9BACT|nr:RNA polymerase sigma-70 factor [Chitinophaga solisilvae]NSL90756.1 RNA polymerase sigma-70 factor [Chitinophaga solisilvae]